MEFSTNKWQVSGSWRGGGGGIWGLPVLVSIFDSILRMTVGSMEDAAAGTGQGQ